MEYDFSDIRPYNDNEVIPILERLLKDEEFLDVIRQLRFKWMPRWLFPLGKYLLVKGLRDRAKKIQTVHDFQMTVERYLDRCVQDTSSGLEVCADQKLDPQKNYLYMSNHRDIVMDPAICNLVCLQTGLGTIRIAIGDNLLSKPFVSDLMRLNKSFIVKRGIENRREKLYELKKLSAYMRASINQDKQSVWVAQREGRAKDGLDKTDTALIKMLLLSKTKEQSFTEGISELHIVPVSISYEWDPCDIAKARELAAIARDGVYNKREHEDISSIAAGITGWKGRINLHFGQEICGNFESVDDIASRIDRQILSNYKIQTSNAVAYQQLEGVLPQLPVESWKEEDLAEARKELTLRLNQLSGDVEAQSQLLKGYANPVYAKLLLANR